MQVIYEQKKFKGDHKNPLRLKSNKLQEEAELGFKRMTGQEIKQFGKWNLWQQNLYWNLFSL